MAEVLRGADMLAVVAGTPCETCAHLAEAYPSGRVMCQGIYRNIPKRVRTWTMRLPCMWMTRPNGTRHANCDDYERAKGQTRMEV